MVTLFSVWQLCLTCLSCVKKNPNLGYLRIFIFLYSYLPLGFFRGWKYEISNDDRAEIVMMIMIDNKQKLDSSVCERCLDVAVAQTAKGFMNLDLENDISYMK